MDFKGRSFLKLLDFSPEEIECLIDFAGELKNKNIYNLGQSFLLCPKTILKLFFIFLICYNFLHSTQST